MAVRVPSTTAQRDRGVDVGIEIEFRPGNGVDRRTGPLEFGRVFTFGQSAAESLPGDPEVERKPLAGCLVLAGQFVAFELLLGIGFGRFLEPAGQIGRRRSSEGGIDLFD